MILCLLDKFLNTKGEYRIEILNHETTSGILYVPKVTFESSNNAVATVNSFGLVQAVSEGETEINVSWCDETKSIPVTVKDTLPYFHAIIYFRADIIDTWRTNDWGTKIQDKGYSIISGENLIQMISRSPPYSGFDFEPIRNSLIYRRQEVGQSIKEFSCPPPSPVNPTTIREEYWYGKTTETSDSVSVDWGIGGNYASLSLRHHYNGYFIHNAYNLNTMFDGTTFFRDHSQELAGFVTIH